MTSYTSDFESVESMILNSIESASACLANSWLDVAKGHYNDACILFRMLEITYWHMDEYVPSYYKEERADLSCMKPRLDNLRQQLKSIEVSLYQTM